jgi:hypothetical protein
VTSWPPAVGGGDVEGPTTSTNASGGIVTVTASATANVKGAYAALLSSTGMDYDGLLVMSGMQTTNVSYLLDVAVGAASSEVILVDDLSQGAQNNLTEWFYIPVQIPSGTRIAARCQCSTLSSTMRVACVGVKGGWFAPPPGGSVVTWGAATSDSGGTPVDAGASAATFGAWAQLVASTAEAVKAVCLRTTPAGNNAAPSTGQWVLQLGVGGAGSEVAVLNVPFLTGTAADNFGPMVQLWFPCSIPAGTRVAARVMSSVTDATDRIVDVVAYGLEC